MTGPSRGRTDVTESASAARPLLRVAAPLRQELIHQIRSSILMFEYSPGTRLVERALCDRYGVSRTVVREALRQLEAEGLVTIVPNRGPVVSTLTHADAVAMFEIRGHLEALTSRLFAMRATPEERQHLADTVDAVAEAFAGGDLQQGLASKDAFYQALCLGAHNEILTGILVGLHARVQLLRGVSLRAEGRHVESLKEIRRICECAVAGDADGAAAAAAFHVEQAAAVALREMAGHLAGEPTGK